MPKLITITPEKINEVKTLLHCMGLRETARKVNISYYTVWCISQGKYDSYEPLQPITKDQL
jgi:hypothetical protein